MVEHKLVSVVTAYREIETYPGKEASAIAAPRSFPKNRIHRFVVSLFTLVISSTFTYQAIW